MIVVCDTSVILNLAWLGQAHVLQSLYESVLVPIEVRAEFERKVAVDPRFGGLAFPAFLIVAEPNNIPLPLVQNPDLDLGEIAALGLALERAIGNVLIDEQAGRAVAVSLGLHVSGLLGVLIEAKQRGLITALQPLIDQLISGARFWIDPALRARVLRLAGESS